MLLISPDIWQHNLLQVLKRIVYIDNFLLRHGYSPTTGYTLVPLLKKNGLTVIPASDKKYQVVRLLHMLATIVKHRKNAVVLIATYSTAAFYFAYSCGWLCRKLRIPYVPCLHGGNLPERIKTSPRLAKRYFDNSRVNVAVSGYLQQALQSNGWKCIVIPNSIPAAQYPYKLRTAASPKLLWVRSFHHVYNPQMAIQVLYELQKKYKDATLTMVGPDKDGSLAECQSLAAALQVTAQVVFTGILSQKDWTALAANHAIFINTTTADNLPVSVIEAMALGLVVISTRVGGIPFLIKDGTNGLLCRKNDVQEMTAKIVNVCTDATLASRLSTNAYHAAKKFDETAVIQQWLHLLHTLLKP